MAKSKQQPAALAAYQAGLRAHHTQTPQTIVLRQAATPATTKGKGKKGGGHRRGQSSEKVLMGMAMGGFALGFIDKQGTAIPTIPILGRAGTIALAAHFIGKGRPGLLTDVRNAAAAVAAYEMGNKGSVSGDGAEGSI